MKEFNTTGLCIPSKHYMVDITDRLEKIKKMVDVGKYFTINRARQYGKTTTLNCLEHFLSSDYDVISLDFQEMTGADYESESKFVRGISRILCDASRIMEAPIPDKYLDRFEKVSDSAEDMNLRALFRIFADWINENKKPIVLIIDEVDTATNSQVFLDFLGRLRADYLKKERNLKYHSFQSVILAGVTDIRYLKSKIRTQSQHRVNSPWNIAADFDIDMSLSGEGIKGMLDEYETEHSTGMDTSLIAGQIRRLTNGYPFLVSRICQLIDNEPDKDWTANGVSVAVGKLLFESNTLFESLSGKLYNYPKLKEALHSVLMEGKKLSWNSLQEEIVQMQMYGFVRRDGGTVKIDNIIFETLLYNLFLSDEELKGNDIYKAGDYAANEFVQGGRLNMRLVLEKFIETFTEIFGPLGDRFKEKDGRELFLLYLKPIINGTGNYYIEAQTRDQTRTDVVVDYLGEQFVIEMKIWRGERYNAKGEEQIASYLDYFGLETGYMLSFNFNKEKETGVKEVRVGEKLLYEATV